MQKPRWILQTLISSCALNLVLLSLFFYFSVTHNPLRFSYQPKQEIFYCEPPISSSFLARLYQVSYEHLLDLLNDVRIVDHGFRVRDFALGALVQCYHFDVERALKRGSLAKRKWEWEGKCFYLFPGLEDDAYDKISYFVAHERWPFTTEGIFNLLHQQGIEKSELPLIQFFCQTREFILLETLFVRTHVPIQKRTLLHLALEAGWELLHDFFSQQKVTADLSAKSRQKFLEQALEKNSPTAAALFLLTDAPFIVKELSDSKIIRLLKLIAIKTPEELAFVQNMATSPRSEAVREQALARMEASLETMPSHLAGHFVEKPVLKDLRPVFRQAPPAAPQPSVHIVQPGESLWLISRKYKISLDYLMEYNHLSSTVIQAGKVLKIPPS